MLKVGRYTAAALLISVGALLLLDQMTGSSTLSLLIEWWPVLLIALGLEYLYFNFMHRNEDRQLKLDFTGIFVSVLISAVVIGSTQVSSLPKQWLNNFNFGIASFSSSGESGFKFDKDPISIPMSTELAKLEIKNYNGNVFLQTGDNDAIIINTTVWIDQANEEEARKIADESKVSYTSGSAVTVEAEGQEYKAGFWGKRKPKMNMTITMPEKHKVDLQLVLTNGKVEGTRLPIKEQLRVTTTNGETKISEIDANVELHTTNGAITVSNINGNAALRTTNGAISLDHVSGKANASTINGSITAKEVGGQLEVHATNGKLDLNELKNEVRAKTTNGEVTVTSQKVAGKWDLNTTNGKINIHLPAKGDYEVDGSSKGHISTNLPLTIHDRDVHGKIGNGTHLIQINTNSSISIQGLE